MKNRFREINKNRKIIKKGLNDLIVLFTILVGNQGKISVLSNTLLSSG